MRSLPAGRDDIRAQIGSLEENTVNGFLEQIEQITTRPARFLLADLDPNPFNPLPESVDSSPASE